MLHHRQIVPLAATLAVAVLAACSGGGGTGSTPATPTIAATTPLTATATATPKSTVATPTPVTATPVPVAATPTPAVATPTPVATAVSAAAVPLGTAQLSGAAGFVNAISHTVYVFDADIAAPGTSTCVGECAAVWPSVSAVAGKTYPAPFTAITRADGSVQLAYSGRPLYTYIADSVAGSIAGDGITSFGATWHIARPAGITAAPAPTPAGPSY